MTHVIGFESGTRYVPPPPTEAWRLSPDGEESHPLVEPLTVPGIEGMDHQGQPCPVVLVTGFPDHDWPMVRDLIRQHVRRVCPWGTLWCSPNVEGMDGYAGMAWHVEGVAVMRTDGAAPSLLSNAFHELWHLVEAWVPPGLLDRLDADLSRGPTYKVERPWGGEPKPYLGTPKERRARAFAHLAMMHIEGAAPPGPTWGDSAWSILARAWTGELGALAAERREAFHLAERRRIAASRPHRFTYDKGGRHEQAA